MINPSLILYRDHTSRIPRPWKTTLCYLAVLTTAEGLIAFRAISAGLILHGFILFALLLQASRNHIRRENRFLVVLSLVPLMRLLNLSLPLSNFAVIYWSALVGVPLSLAVYLCMRLTGLKGRMIGLCLSWRAMPGQLLIGISGVLLGYIEFLILRPEPHINELRLELIWMPALILLIFTGLLEEVIFRGMLHISAMQKLGRLGIPYVAVIFAILHLGHSSSLEVFFMFAVASIYSFLRQRTGSLVGVSLSHGLANIFLYLVFPFLITNP